MNKYSEEFLDECLEAIVKAEEVLSNKELMHELEPLMKARGAKLIQLAEDKPKDLKSLWNEGKKKAMKAEDIDLDEVKDKGERVLAKGEDKMPSKA